VQAEYTPSGSTGGLALPTMRPCAPAPCITLSLFLGPLLACGEDAPTRPEDGTVELWDACVWDGQEIRALCQPELACAWNGICVPRCDMIEECPVFDGFQNECGIDSDEKVCKVRCTDDLGCPETGGAPLNCFKFYCVRDP
jgi:hypothetical protein